MHLAMVAFLPLEFIVRFVCQWHSFLLAMGVALLLCQGCTTLQHPAVTPAPTETPASPAPTHPGTAKPPTKQIPAVQGKLPQTGEASWYGAQYQGKRTASGEIFDQGLFTAAYQTLPFGSTIKTTNLANGKSVEVKVNDRGPAVKDRIIDLSKAAAEALGMLQSGTTPVRLELSSDQSK